MNALQRLLKERRKIPKEERIKMRQDSVDEINTTDVENWVFRPDFHVIDQENFFDDEDADPDSHILKEPRVVDFAQYEKV